MSPEPFYFLNKTCEAGGSDDVNMYSTDISLCRIVIAQYTSYTRTHTHTYCHRKMLEERSVKILEIGRVLSITRYAESTHDLM